MPTTFWSYEYLLMCAAGFVATIAVFLPFSLSGMWASAGGFDMPSTVVCMSFLAIGMFLPGPLCAHFVDIWPRKNVCLVSLMVLALTTYFLPSATSLTGLSALRLVEGAACGVFQMSLGATLINDLSISKHRTQTDYYFLWFQRLALPLSVVVAMMLVRYVTLPVVCNISTALFVISMLLVFSVKVPFRAPSGTCRFSLDRFFTPKAWFLCIDLLLIAILLGAVLFSLPSVRYGVMLFIGLLIAFLTHRTFFEAADDRADAVSGMLLLSVSVILLSRMHDDVTLTFAYILCGLGAGWYGSRMLLYFLKLSAHCQRGTLQQTYILTATLGLCTGYVVFAFGRMTLWLALGLVVTALLWYLLFVHRRFVRIADRDFKFREV